MAVQESQSEPKDDRRMIPMPHGGAVRVGGPHTAHYGILGGAPKNTIRKKAEEQSKHWLKRLELELKNETLSIDQVIRAFEATAKVGIGLKLEFEVTQPILLKLAVRAAEQTFGTEGLATFARNLAQLLEGTEEAREAIDAEFTELTDDVERTGPSEPE